MARNKYSEETKKQFISDYENGIAQSILSKKYNIHKSVICRLIKYYKANNSVETIHRGGRPRVIAHREDNCLVRKIKSNPFMSSRELGNELNLNASTRTIRRRAVDAGLLSFKVVKKPFISAKNRKARLNFANDHINWTTSKWKTVLFSDESKFNLKGSDGLRLVRRPINEALNPRYSKGTIKHGSGNIMVWGCFSGQGIGPIYKIDVIMDRFVYKNILEDVMLPHAEDELPLKWIFQHDNDPKHTAKIVKKWFQERKIEVMEWPAQSPDLNPIENLWEIVDRRIVRDACRNKKELFIQVTEAWNNIPSSIILNLIEYGKEVCHSDQK